MYVQNTNLLGLGEALYIFVKMRPLKSETEIDVVVWEAFNVTEAIIFSIACPQHQTEVLVQRRWDMCRRVTPCKV
jgi:hypothetical protein